MKRFAAIALVGTALTAAAQPSYWWQEELRQGNAQLAQTNWFRPGTGVTITYTNPYVYINATGGGGGGGTNTTFATNALYADWATNWAGSNVLYLLLSNLFTNQCCTNGLNGTNGTNATNFYSYYTNWVSDTNLLTSTNMWTVSNTFQGVLTATNTTNVIVGTFTGNGAGLSNVPCSTTGLSITQNVAVWTGLTNFVAYTNVYHNGLLIASGPVGAGHGASLLLEGGGYLLLENGGTILKE